MTAPTQMAPTPTDASAGEPVAPLLKHHRSIHGGAKSLHLDYPETTRPIQWSWPYIVGIGGVHLLSLAALSPWLFSWSGVVLTLLGLYVFGTLGINLCYHRLLTHQAAVVPKWLEHIFAILGVCCLEDTPARWVAIHRLHHRDSDEQPDPHSPLVTFFWGHCGWLLVKNRGVNNLDTYDRYARDILRDPFYFGLERHLMWLVVYVAHAAVFYLAGLGVGWATTGNLWSGVQLGTSWLVWGVFVRTVLVWHITWSVNSLTHLWGYRLYDTGENSRNNWFVGIVSNGEGWHNNHHADQRAAAHGHMWWEIDVTWLTIRLLAALGLARNIVLPKIWVEQKG
ncbi:MAG: fatty acid desaturase [Pirellulales bacterium]|nr:fatty acid desaturase [Pirellulales bacterium]